MASNGRRGGSMDDMPRWWQPVALEIRAFIREGREFRREMAEYMRQAAEDRKQAAEYARQAADYSKQALEYSRQAAERHKEFLQAMRAVGVIGQAIIKEQRKQTTILEHNTRQLDGIARAMNGRRGNGARGNGR